ncbi:MAG: pilus assembly protein TadG-related protein [Chloroflexi bacterium]|nr:pilus assembly protein TadG-related protein [Chloroflexota bacterium]
MSLRSEKGQVLIFIILGLSAIVALVALAVDGGQLFAERRTAQNAADNAALAAAQALCKNSVPGAAALASAADNGFDNNGATNTVVMHNPPAGGPNAGDNEYAEVIIHSVRDTFFSQLIGQSSLEVTTRAVARCRKSFDYAVLALNTDTTVRGIEVVGDGNLDVNNGAIMSNSGHPTQSIYEDGSGSISADDIHANGGTSCSGCVPAPVAGIPPVPDPLASVPPPTNPGGTCINANYSGSQTITLNPGLYCEIVGDSNVSFVLNPGIYYIDGPGSFAVTSNSTITGSGVMIYLSPTAGAVDMTGNANVNISGCTISSCGDPGYAGMLFYADRAFTQSISMTGNATWNAVGTIYAPSSFLDLSGNGAVNNLSSMIIADTIRLGGNSSVVVNYDPGLNVTPPATVSLVD